MDLKHKDACITENDHIALEGSGNIERSCSISVINSAPAHIVHRESGSPGEFNSLNDIFSSTFFHT